MNQIVDSHVHFWDPNHLKYEWLETVPPINRALLPEDLAAASPNFEIEKIIFVQADCSPEQGVAEAQWVTNLARQHPAVAGIVPFAPLENGPTVASHLETLSSLPLVKGVRRLIQSEPLGFAQQPKFVEGVQQLAQFGLSFDICILHPQLPDVLALVEQCPEVSFVLDHIGKPGIKDSLIDRWREGIIALAGYPNVSCKLSGLVTEADHTAWTRSQLQPYIDHVLAAFSPDRIMFGSDWPVATLASSYERWVETALAATSHLSAEDQGKIFRQNALNFYRIE
ncbi:MAG: amidohydrolase family protein [Chloroflexota bacterium]